MNELAIIVIAVFISLILIYSALQNRRKRVLLINKQKTYLKSLYKNRAVFLCDGADDLGKNLIQFYGDPLGATVRAGMKICDLNGVEYTIKEVYADDETPDIPDFEILDGMTNTAIVIETNTFDWESFRKKIKEEGVVALKLR